jgi:ferredoxin-NADP reductase
VDYKPVTIQKVIEEAKGFKTFIFKEGHHIPYEAGQYLTFVHLSVHGEIRRSYSIVSAPHLGEPLSIGVKRIENGAFSRHLIDHLKPGDTLYTTGAGGLFTLPKDTGNYQRIFFLAAGSGITPIYSLLKTVLYKHPNIKAVLIYSNPDLERTIFYQQLQELQERFTQTFSPLFFFSNAPDLRRARLNRESLQAVLDQYRPEGFDRSLFYICGPEAYMRMCLYTLQEQAIPGENIRQENFAVDRKAPPKKLPPDREQHEVKIRFDGKEYGFTVSYPDSILQAAKKHGISLPYSCEVGRCGNCVARCVSGNVWLSYNEVLTDKDISGGLTLTCTGHPFGGAVRLEIK